MKKGSFVFSILYLILVLYVQKIQEEAVAISIEVPVIVFKEDTIVDNFTIDDFGVYEEGVLHKINAVYLKKDNNKRQFILIVEDAEIDGSKDMIMEDWSMDIFNAFNEAAKAKIIGLPIERDTLPINWDDEKGGTECKNVRS